MRFPTRSLMAATTALALLAGATAMAHTPGQPDGARQAHKAQHMAQHRAEGQAKLKADLKITPAQEAAWTRYVDAHQPPKTAERPDRAAWAQLTTPQRLDQMMAHQAERDAHRTQAMNATRALYAALDAGQQQLFDSRAPMAGGMGQRMGGPDRPGKGMRGHDHGSMRHGG